MKQGFLEQLSSQANKRNRKIFTVLLFLFIGILAFIGFAVKDSIDLSDVTTIKFVIGFSVVVLFFFLSISYVLFYTSRTAVNSGRRIYRNIFRRQATPWRQNPPSALLLADL